MIQIVPMTEADIAESIALWAGTEGMQLRDADSPEALSKFLLRNPACSQVARMGDQLAGVALAGHDGRRGFLHHVAVDQRWRKRGIGQKLVDACLVALKDQGIVKTHIFVFRWNEDGKKFWEQIGWQERSSLAVMSKILSDSENA